MLEQDIFHCSLMACCLEVVLFSYSSQRTFPWIINVFKLASFYFFKVFDNAATGSARLTFRQRRPFLIPLLCR